MSENRAVAYRTWKQDIRHSLVSRTESFWSGFDVDVATWKSAMVVSQTLMTGDV